ncbi:MAG TPA: C4-type zinc ribbon domain-containing protein [Vicinamibacteria bacterium]|nr:C4-type zinc ribbon domain-containing protein [Vicinamibacteria bacterium]
MNAELEKLVRLHKVELETRRLDSELAQVPRERQELEARLTSERSRLDAARAGYEASAKARKVRESAVQDLEGKRSKYKGQLMEVKTNKEYTAMLHEIENVEREIRSLEDQILEEMEKMEALSQEVRKEEAAFKLIEGEARKERVAQDARETGLQTLAQRAREERAAAAVVVPEETLARYERIARLRGSGVAEARDGICGACRVKLRVQVWVEVRRNESLIECDSCSRILYYEPPPPTVAVEP